MRLELHVLKAKICGLQLQGNQVRNQINASKGLSRQGWWARKRELGNVTRYHLLAYGLIREIPYCNIEKKTTNKVDYKLLLDIIHQHIPRWTKKEWTLERVSDLLSNPHKMTRENISLREQE